MSSTRRLDYFAQPIGDFGAITGTGLGNLLGAPAASPLETLLREAIQNSWDARLPETTEVGFSVEYRTLTPPEAACLKTEFTCELPPNVAMADAPSILVLSDSNTRGLAGPTRPSDPAEGYRDFVNFVYMVGETKPLKGSGGVSGGTYGYGRSSLFRVSTPRIVFVHTRCVTSNGAESRLIGMGWTPKFTRDGTQYTGRHWWGRRHDDGWVGPETGDNADTLLAELGVDLPPGTGTTIVVVEPSFADSNEAREQTIESLLRNSWSKMITNEVAFSLRWNGTDVELPDPRQHPTMKYFCRAFDAAASEEKVLGARKFPIELKRPQKHLGYLGLARSPFVRGVSASAELLSGEDEPLHHIALMRSNHLVVEYYEGVRPLEAEQYAGVFLVDEHVEDVFARSEPPTHDSWVPQRLTDRIERSFVNVSLRRITDSTRHFVQPQLAVVPTAKATELAQIAHRLGSILPDTAVPATSGSAGTGGSTGSRRGPSARVRVTGTRCDDRQSHLERVVELEVQHLADSPGSRLTPTVAAMTMSGAEESAPIGAEVPSLLEYRFPDGTVLSAADSAVLEMAPDQHFVELVIRQPRDCEARMNVEIEPLGGSE